MISILVLKRTSGYVGTFTPKLYQNEIKGDQYYGSIDPLDKYMIIWQSRISDEGVEIIVCLQYCSVSTVVCIVPTKNNSNAKYAHFNLSGPRI